MKTNRGGVQRPVGAWIRRDVLVHEVELSKRQGKALGYLPQNGHSDQALTLISEVVTGARSALGADHVYTNLFVATKAEVYETIGDRAAAIDLYQQAAEYGQPDAIKALNQLGVSQQP